MFFVRASFSRLSFVWVLSDIVLLRACPSRLATARLAEDWRAAVFSEAGVRCPEPPARSPPPDCLFTVAQARASASSLGTPLAS